MLFYELMANPCIAVALTGIITIWFAERADTLSRSKGTQLKTGQIQLPKSMALLMLITH
jgi:hypothetical protein